MTTSHPNRILICNSCQRGPDAAALEAEIAVLQRALAAAGLEACFSVSEVGCFGGCREPVGIGFQGQGRASYVFSGTDVTADQTDIMAFCQAYLAAEDGWIVDARPLGRLRHCLRARLPRF